MNPMTNWDDLVLKNPVPAPADEDLAYYYQDYKDFDNLFDEALTTLQDLDVPSGYGQAQPPQRSPRGSSRSHVHSLSQFRHAKKPSGTAIFGFLDHNRELSLGGAMDEIKMKPQEAVKSISPTQLARSHPISNEQLDFNFDQPLEAMKPICLKEEDEGESAAQGEDIIVTNRSPKSYKFPPDPDEGATFDQYLASARPLSRVHHPRQQQPYPDNIDDVALEGPKMKRYVPIPVQEPVPEPVSSSPAFRQNATDLHPPAPAPMYGDYSPSSYARRPYDEHSQDALSMNMNVYLPPPSVGSSSQESPEPHSPSPQILSSPLRSRHVDGSPSVEKRTFYNPQFFSDDAECYYNQPPSQFGSSPTREFPQSSPIRQMNRTMEADDTIVDANETILQLTPLKNQAPITPSTNRITLEWSPIISPNGKATKDVRKAIQDLSPKRMMKKTSLLPPGELDKYWEGPDDEKNFTCVYKNCGKKFTRRYNVRSHIQTHLSDRPFTCTYCPKSFVRQHDLNRHVKSHMVSKHCRCKCGREFTRIEGFKKHVSSGVCSRIEDNSGISKPGAHRIKGETILDGLTSNRLNEELQISF